MFQDFTIHGQSPRLKELFVKTSHAVSHYGHCYLCLQGYESLRHIAKLGGIDVPRAILDIVEPIKDNDEAVRKFGIDFATELCRQILDSGTTYGLHFYTLNREAGVTHTHTHTRG